MADLDIEDIFLNFMLHKSLHPYVGVDLTPYFPEELNTSGRRFIWKHWSRCRMGFRTFPYQAKQAILHAEEKIRGDPGDESNLFRFDQVI